MNGEREVVDGRAGLGVFVFTSTPFKAVFRPPLCARNSIKEQGSTHRIDWQN